MPVGSIATADQLAFDGKPVVAVFGPTDPSRTGPYGQVEFVLRAPQPPACAPCLKPVCRYSEPLACLNRITAAQVAVAVTGVAGPGGGSDSKPVGSVWFGWATPAGVVTQLCRFEGDRQSVRLASVQHALQRLADLLVT